MPSIEEFNPLADDTYVYRGTLPGTLAVDSILTGDDRPAPDILNKAPIRRDDDPPPLMHKGKRVLPIGIGDPYAPFDFD